MQILKSIFSDYKHSSTVSLIITALILLIVLLPIKSDRVPATAMPRMEPSKSQSLRIATEFLKQKYDERLILSFDSEFIPHEYPDKQIHYLLFDGYNQDYEKLHEKYVFTAPRVIRFTDRDIKTGESIDVYVSQAGKVYASAHNNPSQIPSISLSSEEAVTMAFRSLAQFSDADSAAFSVVKLQHQDTPSHRIWNVELQDRSIALNKDASYGYNIEIQGSTVTQALPYFLIPSATEQAIDQNIITVKWIKFSALVVILLFSLSGIKLLFTLSKQGKDVWRSFGFILMIFYFTRENNVSHYRDLIAMVGIEIGFIAYLLALCFFASIVVLFFFSAPSVRLARPSIKGISSQLIPPSLFLIYIIATRYGYRDLTYILSFSYIFDSGFNFFSQIVSILFFIMASMGFIQYFKYLAARFAASSARGPLYISILALLLSTCFVIVNSSLYLSNSIYIYSLIAILTMTAFIYFTCYQYENTLHISMLGMICAIILNPSIMFLQRGDIAFQILGILEITGLFMLADSIARDKSLDFLFKKDI